MRRLSLLLAAGLAAGCTGDEPKGDDTAPEVNDSICTITPGPDVDPESLDCKLGTNDQTFVLVEEGDRVPYHAGPQGGWHVFGSLMTRGVVPGVIDDLTSPDTPLIKYKVTRDGELYGGVDYQQPRWLTDAGDGWHQHIGEQLVLAILDTYEADGAEVVMSFELTDANGSILSAELPVALYYEHIEIEDTGLSDDTGTSDTSDTGTADTGDTGDTGAPK